MGKLKNGKRSFSWINGKCGINPGVCFQQGMGLIHLWQDGGPASPPQAVLLTVCFIYFLDTPRDSETAGGSLYDELAYHMQHLSCMTCSPLSAPASRVQITLTTSASSRGSMPLSEEGRADDAPQEHGCTVQQYGYGYGYEYGNFLFAVRCA